MAPYNAQPWTSANHPLPTSRGQTSGPDPARDTLLAVQLSLAGPEGLETRLWEADESGSFRGGTRVVEGTDVQQEILEHVGRLPVVCADADAARAWWLHLANRAHIGSPNLIDIASISALFFCPSRSQSPLNASDHTERSAPALAEVLHRLVAQHQERDPSVRRFLSLSLWRCIEAYRSEDPTTAEWIETVFRHFEPRIDTLTLESPTPAIAFRRLRPEFASDLKALLELEPLPRRLPPDTTAIPGALQSTLDRVFDTLGNNGATNSSENIDYRPGQHELARQILDTLESSSVTLVDAPTGTGKTLAYMIPLLLWTAANSVRGAMSTYTRTLQDQAYERELARCLDLLHQSGWAETPRVQLLKGRTNYLCSRMLVPLCPDRADPPEEHLAWYLMALFALEDPNGDLDRLIMRPPLFVPNAPRVREALQRLRNESACQPMCCTTRSEQSRCGASVARRRAERAHLIITNHAFVLSDPEFFGTIVFDECDHLHAQALSIVSTDLRSTDLLLTIRALGGGPRRSAGLLQQASRAFPSSGEDTLFDDPVSRIVEDCKYGVHDLFAAFDDFDERIRAFLRWRHTHERERASEEKYQMLREYLSQELGEPLLHAHTNLCKTFQELCTRLANLEEELGAESSRGLHRLRTRLARRRAALAEQCEELAEWLPRRDGELHFESVYFFDIEERTPEEWVLVRRILLPHVYLGRHLFPRLGGVVLLSASTYLRGGFDTIQAYLGLDLLSREPDLTNDLEPPPPENFTPRAVTEHRAPSTFDYQRALVVVPKDSPAYGAWGEEKIRFLRFVARYIGFLAERTEGRTLALFTNVQDVVETGRRLDGFLRARQIDCYYQRMPGHLKEELPELFRKAPRAVLLGVDTFWYGVDFPGETLEHVVLVKLPYGAIDRFHQAQCATLGRSEQRRRIYLPEACAMFRQGFGRLLRSTDDQGVVHILDHRILQPRHRFFLNELPGWDAPDGNRPQHLVAPSRSCIEAALRHTGRLEHALAEGHGFAFEPHGSFDAAADPYEPPHDPFQ